MNCRIAIWAIGVLMFLTAVRAAAQTSVNDTLRIGMASINGQDELMILLPEFVLNSESLNAEDRARRDKLRNDIYVVYPYAITAAAVLRDVNAHLDNMDRRHDRKKYLKSIDKTLDAAFKQPLKNLSINQGHVLIKLINRQTGRNCYSIIKELKGGFSAMVWQSVGVFFNNNLARDYDPDGDDHELETLVRELESSNAYRYQLYQQKQLMSIIAKQK